MGKIKHGNTFHTRPTPRSLLAVSIAASLAAFSCTTNHNLGNGTPTRTPEVRMAPTSGVTSGGESYTPPSNPPMMSSYTRNEALTPVTQRSIRRSPDDAAAIMAGLRPASGRYLGVVSPRSGGRAYASDAIDTSINTALRSNPQITVNASISSPPTPAITSGLEGPAGTGGTTAAATIAGTGEGIPAVGEIAGTTTLPTMASANVPSVTAASTGAARTTATTTGATAAATTPATAGGTRIGSVTAPIRILRSTTGNVTVTNVGTRNP